jgi:NADH-quinone oxidoreductase subunit J
MSLGIVDIPPQLAAGSPLTPLPCAVVSLLAQAGHDSSAASPLNTPLISPVLILALCIGAGVGTFFLLPGGSRGPAVRSIGGVMMLFAALVLALAAIRSVATNFGGVGGPGVYFWIFSAIALFGALRVVTHPRPVYAALYFVLTVFATAGLFILLWAEFMAAALVIIYAGAILVTYVFVIMLAASTARAGVDKLAEYDEVSRDPVIASAVGFALMGVLLFVIFDRAEHLPSGPHTYTFAATKVDKHGRTIEVADEVNAPTPAAALAAVPPGLTPVPDRMPEPSFSIQALGRYLFREQAVNLELAGLTLTLGMIGAILIARRHVVVPGGAALSRPGDERDAFNAPATPISDDPFSIPVYGTDNPAQKAYPET